MCELDYCEYVPEGARNNSIWAVEAVHSVQDAKDVKTVKVVVKTVVKTVVKVVVKAVELKMSILFLVFSFCQSTWEVWYLLYIPYTWHLCFYW